MKFSAQEEYGLRCLLQIAKNGAGHGLTIPQISQAESLSEANTAKLLRVLRMAGFIEAARGQEGGYRLARPAEQLRVSEILNALGGKLFDDEFCDKHAGFEKTCYHATDCSIRHLWQTIQGAVDVVLARTTLQDLLGSEAQLMTKIALPERLTATPS